MLKQIPVALIILASSWRFPLCNPKGHLPISVPSSLLTRARPGTCSEEPDTLSLNCLQCSPEIGKTTTQLWGTGGKHLLRFIFLSLQPGECITEASVQ